ncbi:MAG: glycosyltransferase family 8 protein [Microthrixaceae bacterium]|nr:glycosyltransferase family 8 protein [Microthrixaceae bacterium]
MYDVVVATDAGFAMPTAVALRSLIMSGGGPFRVTVIHDSVDEQLQMRIRRSLPASDHELSFIDSTPFVVNRSRSNHLPVATYFRLFLADVLPQCRGRVLYLDVDVLVRRDVTALWDLDVHDNALAAVQSVHYPFVATRGAVNDWRKLGLDPATRFFNAGVMLVDLERWRGADVKRSALSYLESDSLGGGADQEALNVALSGRWEALTPTWNQQTPLLSDHHGAHLIFSEGEIDEARSDPAIVHFQTRPKPWHRGCTHPWRQDWLECAANVEFDGIEGRRERRLPAEARWRARRAASAILKGR